MSRTPRWVEKTIKTIPSEIDEDHLAALMLTITQAYFENKGPQAKSETVRFIFSLVVTYCMSIGLSVLGTKLVFAQAADMIMDASDPDDIPEPTAPIQ